MADAIGGETLVNASVGGHQLAPGIAALKGGGAAIVWVSFGDDFHLAGIYARLTDPSGNPIGGEFQVNTAAWNGQSDARIVALESGGFVVIWTSPDEDQGQNGVYGQIYGANGARLGGEFQINDTPLAEFSSESLSLVPLPSGGFMAIYETPDDTPEATLDYTDQLRGRVFNGNGNPIGGEFRVSGRSEVDQSNSTASALADGSVVVTWSERELDGEDGSLHAVRGQRLTANGVRLGPEFRIAASAQETRAEPSVTGLEGGGFVVAWIQGDTIEGEEIATVWAQLYGAAGAPVGAAFRINTTIEGAQFGASMTPLPGGGFVAVWTNLAGGDEEATDVYAQIFDAQGGKVGEAFPVNLTTEGQQASFGAGFRGVARLEDGAIAITWEGSGLGDDWGVFLRRFSIAGEAGPIVGTNGPDRLAGTAGDDVLQGLGGNDVLNGGAGADEMDGGAGNDIFIVDNIRDRVLEALDQGADTVKSMVSFRLGAHLERLTLTGEGASRGTGNALANILTGNSADNILDGGAGADRMLGGGGNDSYVVDRAQDRVIEAAGAGIDRVMSAASFTLGAHVEQLTLTGSEATRGAGNGLANRLVGNGAANVLDGAGGADRMFGGGGNDVFHADHVGDRAVEGAGAGADTVRSSVSFTLGVHVEKLVLIGTAAAGIGNSSDNTLTGNAAPNLLKGATGSDQISAGGGNDRLYGGAGADGLRGGAGSDQFYFDTALLGGHFDRLLDFSAAADTIRLDRGIFNAIAEGRLTASAFEAGIAADDDQDRIIYDPASGEIFYDADGSGVGAAVLFARVAAGTALNHLDFVGYTG